VRQRFEAPRCDDVTVRPEALLAVSALAASRPARASH